MCVSCNMADRRTLTKRNGQRKVLESLIERASTIVEGGSSRCPEKELAALVKNIKLKKDSIDALNEQILDAITEEEIDDELKTSSELDLLVDTELEILTDCLKKLSLGKDENRAASSSPEVSPVSSISARSISPAQSEVGRRHVDDVSPDRSVIHSDFGSRSCTSSRPSSRASSPARRDENCLGASTRERGRNRVRLPKLEMKKFGGDPVVWPEFYETFKVSVHENGDLSDVERFSYLKHYVFGEAASCIQGLPLSSDNYSEALKLLEDRFGNRQLIVAKHMNALLDLARVHSSTSVKELRSLFDKITVNIRALRALGISSEQFGPMLSPVIMKTLPEDMKLEISRRLGGRWKIDEILSVLGVEIKTREAFAGPPREENRRRERKDRDHREPPPRTTESLAVNSRDVRNCVFCDAVHPLEKCPLSVSERYEAAKKGRLCFRCLGSRHSAKACKSKSKCSSCNGNRHHSALCNSTGAPPPESY